MVGAGIWTAFAAILAAIVGGLAAKDTSSVDEIPVSSGYQGVREQARKLAGILSLGKTETQSLERLFLIQSWSESKGNINAANKSDSEAAAAKAMYESRGNADKLKSAVGTFPAGEWSYPGSAGWFGLMSVVLLNVVRGRNAKGIGLGPKSNRDPWASTVIYAAYIGALVRRKEWSNSSQDAYALKAGGAAGSLMDDPQKARYQTAARHVDKAMRALGIPKSFAKKTIRARSMFGGRDWLAVYKEGL